MNISLLLLYKKVYHWGIIVILSFFIVACESQNNNTKQYNDKTHTSTQTGDNILTPDHSTPNSPPLEIKFNDKVFGTISSWNENETSINANHQIITGRLSKNEKTKYYDPSGDVIAEIKYKETGFKLRKPDGALLWKIKVKDNKIKISNNAGNKNPYEIKKKEGKYKIKRVEQELGKVTFDGNEVKIKTGKGVFQLTSNVDSYAYGVLAIDEISVEHRLIIMAELLKGKK